MGSKQENKDTTRVTLLRNRVIRNWSVEDFLTQMDYETSYGEPVWFKSDHYKQPKMFIGDMDGRLVCVGPYMAGDGIEINNNINQEKLGEIRMKYPIPVLSGNGGKVLAVKETENGIEWIDTGLSIKHGTKAYWEEHKTYVPEEGEIIIYDDRFVENGIMYPGIKVGTSNAYVGDLAFVGEYELDNHIKNTEIHITQEERERWNNKLNTDDISGVVDETLIFNRN